MDNIKMLFEWVVEVSVTGMFYHFIKNEDSAIVNDFSVSADLNLTTSNHGTFHTRWQCCVSCLASAIGVG